MNEEVSRVAKPWCPYCGGRNTFVEHRDTSIEFNCRTFRARVRHGTSLDEEDNTVIRMNCSCTDCLAHFGFEKRGATRNAPFLNG